MICIDICYPCDLESGYLGLDLNDGCKFTVVRNRSIYLELIAANAFFVIQLHHVSFPSGQNRVVFCMSLMMELDHTGEHRRVPGPKTPPPR